MATNTARGLSPAELEQIRDTLAAGRKPKVTFTDAAGQIAGQVGQVVELTDPQLSDEWVVVRFGRDELPFSPADLAIPTRPARKTAEPKAEAKPDQPAFKLDKPPAVAPPRKEVPVPSSTVEAPAKPVNGVAPAKAVNGVAPAKAAVKKVAKPKAPAALTVVVAYAEGEWTVAATKGEKPLAKPYVIRPSEALKMVAMLDVPGVHDAVEHILSAERAQAEDAAQRLRAELADIEARLAELKAVG